MYSLLYHVLLIYLSNEGLILFHEALSAHLVTHFDLLLVDLEEVFLRRTFILVLLQIACQFTLYFLDFELVLGVLDISLDYIVAQFTLHLRQFHLTGICLLFLRKECRNLDVAPFFRLNTDVYLVRKLIPLRIQAVKI